MNLRSWVVVGLVVGLVGVSGIARGDAPKIEGRLALGVRASSGNPDPAVLSDDAGTRVAADGSVGLRFGRTVVGLHAGLATPLHFYASPSGDEGETEPYTEASVYPVDLGLAAQVDATAGVWVSAWIGVTEAFAHMSSPAQHLDNIEYFGDVPARAWRTRSTSLGFGATVGYDAFHTAYGRGGIVLSVESQGLDGIQYRDSNGTYISSAGDVTYRSVTLGVSYAY